MNIRRAIFDDLSTLKDFVIKNSDGYSISHDSWIAYLSCEQYVVFVAFDGDSSDVLGVCIALVASRDIDIVYILVSEEHRRNGVGRSLLNHLITDISPEKIFIDVSVLNKNAIEFYKCMGFKVVGIRKQYYDNIDSLTCIKYCV